MRIIFIFLSVSVWNFTALAFAQPLTQNEYDRLLAEQLEMIQYSKKYLDDTTMVVSASEKMQMLCTRMQAYQEIEKISKENIQLMNAHAMLLASRYYLDRQYQSLSQGGLTASKFCH